MASSVSKRIFGADLNSDIKKILEARQKLAKESQPLESIQNISEDYQANFLDEDNNILNDLGSRTPFVRMWVGLQVQKHTKVDSIDNSDGNFNIKAQREKDQLDKKNRLYQTKGDNIEISVMSNLAVQSALCRLHYRRDWDPIRAWDNLEDQGKYWKRVYNTIEGRGTVNHFIKANQSVVVH